MNAQRPRLWFAGTPQFAATIFKALCDSEAYSIDLVLTQPDRPAGRGQKLQMSEVKQSALALNLPVEQPEKLNDPKRFEALLETLPRPDLVIVVAYGLLLPEWFLQLPRLGCINVHGSLLPRWRGAAPIQRAIEAGDLETGVGIMQMERGLDTGAVWHEARLPIADNDTTQTLHDKLAELGAKALLEALPIILAQSALPTPQHHDLATYAHKLSKVEAELDWQQPLAVLERKIRAFYPYPIAQSQLGQDWVRIHRASAHPSTTAPQSALGTILRHDKTGVWVQANGGLLCIEQLQFPNKKVIAASDLRNSHDLTHQIFTSRTES